MTCRCPRTVDPNAHEPCCPVLEDAIEIVLSSLGVEHERLKTELAVALDPDPAGTAETIAAMRQYRQSEPS